MLGKNTVIVIGFVALASLCIGLLVNQYREQPLPLKYQDKETRLDRSVAKIAEVPESKATDSALPKELTLEQFRAYAENRSGLVLDARPEIFHRLGHVPGALSLPREDFENGYASLKAKLESNKHQPIAVYCSSTSCEDSHLVEKALVKLGYTNVVVFSGGWATWTEVGLRQEKAE
jgi:rhodanese-related sulfurtransferase